MSITNAMMLAQFQPSMISNYFTHYKASNATLEYVAGATTVTGTSGASTVTYSGTQATILAANMLVRFKGTDIYTVTSVSGITVGVSPNLVQNYVADTEEVQRVSSLNDLSINAYHATGASSTEPSIIPSFNNGKTVLKFDNSKFLTLPSGFYSNFSTGANTAVVIAQSTTQGSATQALFSLSGSGAVKNTLFYNTTGTGDIEYRSANSAATAISSGNITQTNMSFYTGRRSGSTQAVAQNNVAEATNANGANCTADSGRIGQTAAGGFVFTGQIAEMIFYNKSLSALEMTLLYNYAKSEYTIS